MIDVGHKTYRKNRTVMAGFASRSLNMDTYVDYKRGVVGARLGVRKEAYYALQFVELGTSKQPAQPWLVPALERSKDSSIGIIADQMKARIERIARKRAAG
jgi:HK97 gp10 family phage protein